MTDYFQIIMIVLIAWAGAVSLATGKIYLRSGETSKGLIPRFFGLLLVLAAVVLILRKSGAIPEALQPASTYVVAGLLVLAVLIQAVF